jgi:hypothetical protein
MNATVLIGFLSSFLWLRQKFCQFGALHQANVFPGRECARVVGDFSGSDINAFVRFARQPGGIEFLQRFDPGARDLPALAADQRHARRFGQFKIGPGDIQPAHAVAVAPEGVFEGGRELLPGQGAQSFERAGDPFGAGRAQLPPSGMAADGEEG